MEGTIASVPPQGGRKHPQQEFLQIDTTNILFICSGSFAGLEKSILSRKKGAAIGFDADIKNIKEPNTKILVSDKKLEIYFFVFLHAIFLFFFKTRLEHLFLYNTSYFL